VTESVCVVREIDDGEANRSAVETSDGGAETENHGDVSETEIANDDDGHCERT
jgi:hypothetical protein